jgi:uncharacterized phage protein gp47/JayE
MTSYGITASGFVLKSFEDIITDMKAEAQVQFGNDIDLSATSPLLMFINVVAAEQALLWQQLEEAYYAGYLDSASGTNLDNIIVLLGFVRRAAIKATGSVTFTGTNGTVIPANSEIQTAGSSPVVFKTDAVATISGTTAAVNITAKVAGAAGNVAANTISVMTAPISGISAVNNSAIISGGVDVETDEQFRNRFKLSLSTSGAATVDAIRAGVIGVTGVTSCSMEENDTVTDNTGSGGLPPKSFRVSVLGGTDNAVAQGIFDNKPAGIQSYGTSSGTATANDGTTYTINFRRPTDVQIYVDVVLTTGATFPTDGLTQVETAIISYIGGTDANAVLHLGLGIGDDVIFNEVVSAVMGIEGVLDAVVKTAKTATPTGTTNIVIAATEKAGTTTVKCTVA